MDRAMRVDKRQKMDTAKVRAVVYTNIPRGTSTSGLTSTVGGAVIKLIGCIVDCWACHSPPVSFIC